MGRRRGGRFTRAATRPAGVGTMGAATLATTVGQPSLGNLIFSGLQTENWIRVLVGCAAAAALALGVDGLLAMVESGLKRRSRQRVLVGLTVLAAALALAFAPFGRSAAGGETVVIGAKNFSEQYILASAIERRLRAAGYRTERRDNLGSTIAYQALAAGDIDVYVDYGGGRLGEKPLPPPNFPPPGGGGPHTARPPRPPRRPGGGGAGRLKMHAL